MCCTVIYGIQCSNLAVDQGSLIIKKHINHAITASKMYSQLTRLMANLYFMLRKLRIHILT